MLPDRFHEIIRKRNRAQKPKQRQNASHINKIFVAGKFRENGNYTYHIGYEQIEGGNAVGQAGAYSKPDGYHNKANAECENGNVKTYGKHS